jgi:hypothetical protein
MVRGELILWTTTGNNERYMTCLIGTASLYQV